ncbi:TPA: LOW QUALITY PROTEIN: hypothetical protein N0F65_007336 [Lagenidium giganteum]|uniref:Uncharacterized protein n=1 Tax=Lagenidium giganteum TaxID=4803 RepID=A0AAV2Z7R3_9STRA|nr:TPA: LOW QUALITY PROTEIN: hypothetical protein N0F65_007336 [Lagenidium giganteum]
MLRWCTDRVTHLIARERGHVETSPDFGPMAETLKHQEEARSRVLDSELPFSWLRLGGSLLSYLLLCSDIPRTGLGYKSLQQYNMLEPGVFQFFGPWGYPVNMIFQNATEGQSRIWSYKFDTTSVVWRSFAKHLKVPEYPSCFLYEGDCHDTLFQRKEAFAMLDAMASAVANLKSSHDRPGQAIVAPTLRTENPFYDRVHHYLMPTIFVNPTWRTNHALHYPQEVLGDGVINLCLAGRKRPYFCDDIWTDSRHACAANDNDCKSIGLIWVDTLARYRGAIFDNEHRFTFLESAEDHQTIKGGLVLHARGLIDISAIMRVRNCTHNSTNSCESIYVGDHRYEGAIVTSDAVDWYILLAILRGIGQLYFYLRLLMLVAGCYCMRSAEPHYARASIFRKSYLALKTFACLPSQSVIYGSPFPTLCYSIAHFIDAPFTYEVIAERSTTMEFILIASVQMRNVWFIAIAMQALVYLTTKRACWFPSKGIVGFPEFSLGFVSCITIFTHYRELAFRNTKVLSIHPVPDIIRNPQDVTRVVYIPMAGGNMWLEGVVLDLKFFLCIVLCILAIWLLAHATWTLVYGWQTKPVNMFCDRMAVPYSAGTLWPTAAFCVYWQPSMLPQLKSGRRRDTYSTSLSKYIPSKRTSTIEEEEELSDQATSPTKPWKVGSFNWRSAMGMRKPARPATDQRQGRRAPGAVVSSMSKTLAFQLENIHLRADEVDTIVALINVVAMTDPIVFLHLCVFRGENVCLVQSTETGRVFLLPERVLISRAHGIFSTDNAMVLRVFNTKQLRWSTLLHCG